MDIILPVGRICARKGGRARARRRCDHCKHSDAGLMDGGEKAIAFLLSMPRDQPDGCERAILEAGVAEPGHHGLLRAWRTTGNGAALSVAPRGQHAAVDLKRR